MYQVCSKRGQYSCRVLCISPGNDFLFGFGSNDKLILLRCPQNVYLAVQEAIHLTSKFKVQCETSFTYHDEEVIEIKMTGEPWAALEEEFTPSRRLLVEMTKRIKDLNWTFLGAANLKGFSDALFFLQNASDQEGLQHLSGVSSLDNSPVKGLKNNKTYHRENRQNIPIALVSLNGLDRLRLLEFRDPEIVPIISWTISHLYDSSNFKPIIGDYFGSTEFVLPDTPFHCDDNAGLSIIRSRTMICAILSALNSRGWEVLTSFESPVSSSNLSVLLMSRCSPCVYPYSCISMNGPNQISFIAFRPNDCDTLKKIANQAYAPGIEMEEECLDSCETDDGNQSQSVSFTLKGQPWTDHSAYSCHGKSMLLLLLVKAEILGYRLIASINASNKTVKIQETCCNSSEIPADVDSWFFRFVGECQRPFKQQPFTNPSVYNDCNGYASDQTTQANTQGPVNEGYLPFKSPNFSNATEIISGSTNHTNKLHTEMSYLKAFVSNGDQRHHHNCLSKTILACPGSLHTQEEKLMTTLV